MLGNIKTASYWMGGAVFLLALCGCHHHPPLPSRTPSHSTQPVTTPEPIQSPAAERLRTQPGLRASLPQGADHGAVTIQVPASCTTVYRSYSPIYGLPRENTVALPASKGVAQDSVHPDGVELYYAVATGEGKPALTTTLRVPARALPPLSSPTLLVDKAHYTLQVLDRGSVVKSYPIALGASPENRKYCQDMASTPEGWYQVYNLQPQATYYKALDIDYPRPVDRVRHSLYVESNEIEAERPIGGEIQIHGLGVARNWTAGCMAMRNEDIDELFADSAVRAGMPVYIHGYQFHLADREWLKNPPAEAVRKVQERLIAADLYHGGADGSLGEATALALGRYQRGHRLPVSCALDGQTRAHFGLSH